MTSCPACAAKVVMGFDHQGRGIVLDPGPYVFELYDPNKSPVPVGRARGSALKRALAARPKTQLELFPTP